MPETPLALRALSYAPQSLTLPECLGLLIDPAAGLPVARELLRAIGGESDDPLPALEALTEQAELGQHSIPRVVGLDDSARARVMAALTLARKIRSLQEGRRLRRPVNGDSLFAESLEQIPHEFRLETREWIGVVTLSSRGTWAPLQLIARGVRNHVNFSPADLFRLVLVQRVRGFCLYHNHPSGSCLPSPVDIDLTELVLDLSLTLGVVFLGHGIVGPGSEHWIDGRAFLAERQRRESQV